MNAWRTPTARVARELWLAIFTHDTALVRRTAARIRRRLFPTVYVGDVKEAAAEALCGALATLCVVTFVVLMMSGGRA